MNMCCGALINRLYRDSFVTEVFSRANSLKWFAAKRRDGREIYAEVGRKDASLVDVDQEVEALL